MSDFYDNFTEDFTFKIIGLSLLFYSSCGEVIIRFVGEKSEGKGYNWEITKEKSLGQMTSMYD